MPFQINNSLPVYKNFKNTSSVYEDRDWKYIYLITVKLEDQLQRSHNVED